MTIQWYKANKARYTTFLRTDMILAFTRRKKTSNELVPNAKLLKILSQFKKKKNQRGVHFFSFSKMHKK